MMCNNKFTLLLLIILLPLGKSIAQEVKNVSQYRVGVAMDWKLFNVKGLKFSLEPEFRLDDSFSVERFQVETALRYRTFDMIYWGASYRLNVEGNDNDYAYGSRTDKFGQYGLYVMAKKDFGRFSPSLRALYSNYTDEETTDKEYMRYRAKVAYNIKGVPLNPYVAIEAFQSIEESLLYKTRFTVGTNFKVKKDNYIDFNYRLDYFALKYKNRHIFSLGYKVSF